MFYNQGKKEGDGEASAAFSPCKKAEILPCVLGMILFMSHWTEWGNIPLSSREAGKKLFYILYNGRFIVSSGVSLNVTSSEKPSLIAVCNAGLPSYSLV